MTRLRPSFRLPFRLLVLALVAACGQVVSDGGGGGGDDGGGDGDGDDAGEVVVPSDCSVTAQDCPGGYKCTYVVRGILEHGCRPLTGARQEGETCTGRDGDDDCDAGLLCDEGLQVCVRFCDEASDCASDQGCVWFRAGDGLCRAPCTLFDPSSCPEGATCELEAAYGVENTVTTYCRLTGTVTSWQSCSPLDTCAPDHSCLAFTCVPHCDDDHPCVDSNTTCMPPASYPYPNPTNAGACL